jgi:tetratricopeptide (TPR) repeat protein
MRNFVSLILCVSLCVSLHAQTSATDSLTNVINTTDNDTVRIRAMARLARAYLYTNIDTSLKIAHSGMLKARQIGYAAGEADCMSRLAQGYESKSDYSRAMGYYLSALKMGEKLGENMIVNRCYGGLAGAYVYLGDFEKALEYDLRAKEISTGDALINANLNIGDDYEKLNRLDSAKYYTNQGYDLAVKYKVEDAIANALNNLGNIFRKMNQPEVALGNYRLSLEQNKGVNAGMYCESTLGLAMIFYKLNRIDSALHYAKRSFQRANSENYMVETLAAGKFLAKHYRDKNEVDSAYVYLTHVIQSRDSLYSEERTSQIKNMFIEETMRQQEIEINKSIAEQERSMYIQFAIIAVGLVTFVIVFFLLSQSIIINEKWVRFLGVLALLLVFEFINLLIHPWLESITNHSPALMLLILVGIASLLIPLHHRIEQWIDHKIVSKNKRLRLSIARRIVARLEKEGNVS